MRDSTLVTKVTDVARVTSLRKRGCQAPLFGKVLGLYRAGTWDWATPLGFQTRIRSRSEEAKCPPNWVPTWARKPSGLRDVTRGNNNPGPIPYDG